MEKMQDIIVPILSLLLSLILVIVFIAFGKDRNVIIVNLLIRT